MIAMTGKYIVSIEKSRLILTHPAGISFDLTQEDARELAVLISNWQLAIRMGLYEKKQEAKQMEEDKTTKSDEKHSHLVSESLHYEG
jgi:hypothetical protein